MFRRLITVAIPTSRQTPPVHASYLWLAGNEGMEKKIETGIRGLGFRRNGKDNGKYCHGLYSTLFLGMNSFIPS